MPAAAIGALVDLQAAFTLLLTPRKVLLRFCQRGVTVLRFARLVSLGAVALFRKMGMARILPREHVVKRIEAAQLRVELRLLLRPRRAILPRGHSLPPPQNKSPHHIPSCAVLSNNFRYCETGHRTVGGHAPRQAIADSSSSLTSPSPTRCSPRCSRSSRSP